MHCTRYESKPNQYFGRNLIVEASETAAVALEQLTSFPSGNRVNDDLNLQRGGEEMPTTRNRTRNKKSVAPSFSAVKNKNERATFVVSVLVERRTDLIRILVSCVLVGFRVERKVRVPHRRFD
jgi:hypothetical protein